MSFNVHEVEQALLSLNQRERAAVIQRGLDSLNFDVRSADTQHEVDSAWRTETLRRLDDIENGQLDLHDVEESHRQIRAELAARRK